MKLDLTKDAACAKLTTVAILEKDGKYWLGTNSCRNPQDDCPRGNMPSGVGYELCNDICQITGHAEVNAMKAAGKDNCIGSTLYLFGHYRVCEDCMKVATENKVKRILIMGINKKEIKMGAVDTIKGWFSAFFGKFLIAFNAFIQSAIPPAKQILIAEFKDISVAVIKELALTNLTSEAKRIEAFKRIKDAIIANGKEASSSLVNLLIELAYSQYQNSQPK